MFAANMPKCAHIGGAHTSTTAHTCARTRAIIGYQGMRTDQYIRQHTSISLTHMRDNKSALAYLALSY